MRIDIDKLWRYGPAGCNSTKSDLHLNRDLTPEEHAIQDLTDTLYNIKIELEKEEFFDYLLHKNKSIKS